MSFGSLRFMPTNEMSDTYMYINKHRDKTFVETLLDKSREILLGTTLVI